MLPWICFYMCVTSAWGRDVTKFFRTIPAVTNSLVNLGKMDIAFYINGKPQDFKPNQVEPALEEPCPCSGLKNFKDSSRSHPSDILTKLLHSNDLFSFKEPMVSTLCCDSHEQVRDDSVLFEFGPKESQVIAGPLQSQQFPMPFILESLLTGKQTHPVSPLKQKVVELFVLPKKKDVKFDNKNTKKINKSGIQVVGDKEIRNDFKTMKFLPPQPSYSSVKKDLTLQESKTQDKKEEVLKSIPNTNLV